MLGPARDRVGRCVGLKLAGVVWKNLLTNRGRKTTTSLYTGAPQEVCRCLWEAEGALPRCRSSLWVEYAEAGGVGGGGEAGDDVDQQWPESDKKVLPWFCKKMRAAVGLTFFCQATVSYNWMLYTDLESPWRPF